MGLGPLSYLGNGVTTMPAGVASPAAGPAPLRPSAPYSPPPGAMSGFPVPDGMGPSLDPTGALGPMPMQEFAAEQQSDGTVLLRMKNPDGTPGPVVKIITLGGKAKAASPGT